MEELNMIAQHLNESITPGEPQCVDNIHDSRVQEYIRSTSARVAKAVETPAATAQLQPPDCLLPGALLAARYGEKPGVLHMQRNEDECRVYLARRYDIVDTETAIDALQWLATGGDVSVDENTHLQLRAGAFTLFEPMQIDRYENCLISLVEQLDFAPELVEGCHTIAAWRAERIAWLARVTLHVGFLRAGEAYQWLRFALTLTKQNFTRWDEYIISACFGSAVTGNGSPQLLQSARDLWVHRPLAWGAYPIAEL